LSGGDWNQRWVAGFAGLWVSRESLSGEFHGDYGGEFLELFHEPEVWLEDFEWKIASKVHGF